MSNTKPVNEDIEDISKLLSAADSCSLKVEISHAMMGTVDRLGRDVHRCYWKKNTKLLWLRALFRSFVLSMLL